MTDEAVDAEVNTIREEYAEEEAKAAESEVEDGRVARAGLGPTHRPRRGGEALRRRGRS